MSFIKKLFGSKSEVGNAVNEIASSIAEKTNILTKPSISGKMMKFGRYTDCNKTKEQIHHWDNAKAHFKNKAYVDSFEQFLLYLRDPELDNVQVNREGNRVSFQFIQGSKQIKGYGDENEFVAESSIVIMNEPSIPVMRKLMVINYGLNYTTFSLHDKTLKLRFSTHTIDASPDKLYASLAELAKKADQQDDLLLGEFSDLKEIDTDHLVESDPKIQNIQYSFLMQWIDDTMFIIQSYDQQIMSGGISYLLLNLTYKIDYLLVPQGEITDALERIQSLFFSKNNWTTAERNKKIIEEYQSLKQLPKERIQEGLYGVKCTFGLPRPTSQQNVMKMMFGERDKTGWYRDNQYHEVVESIYGYMVTYAFFNYGMLYPVNNLLNLAMNVMNPDYYLQMGSEVVFVNQDNSLNKQNIVLAIKGIIADAKKDFPYIGFDTQKLVFTSKSLFMDSLILELDKIDLRKK